MVKYVKKRGSVKMDNTVWGKNITFRQLGNSMDRLLRINEIYETNASKEGAYDSE